MHITSVLLLVLKVSILFMVLGFGLRAKPSDAFYLFHNPGRLLRSVLAMHVLMPVLTFLIVSIADLSPLIATTLLAISLSPLAPLFPKNPLKAGGQESYVIGLMAEAAILSVILIPLSLKILSRIVQMPLEVSAGSILLTVAVSVLIPLAVGITIRHFAPAFSRKAAPYVTRIAGIFLVISIIPVMVKVFPAILQLIGNGTVLAIAAFVLLGFFTGHLLGGPEIQNRSVLALASASRHPAVALSVASANLTNHSHVPAAILLYLLINATAAFFYLKWLKKSHPEIPTQAS